MPQHDAFQSAFGLCEETLKSRHPRKWATGLCSVMLLLSGCHSADKQPVAKHVEEADHSSPIARMSHETPANERHDWEHEKAPVRLKEALEGIDQREPWNLTLDECLRIALENSEVLRDLGGAVLRTPSEINTRFRNSIAETDPQYGPEAALSAFDAQFRTSGFFEKNDRAINNTFFGGGTRALTQDMHQYQSELGKRSALGTQYFVRGTSIYDNNNSPQNIFGSAWDSYVDFEVRQPWLQGGGSEFNRIAGPSAMPGVINGIEIARVSTDINEIDFEMGIRDFTSNVENAYWDLYFAYGDFSAKREARDYAFQIWQNSKEVAPIATRDDAAKEYIALEQYHRYDEELKDALVGKLMQPTQAGSGSSGGTFRGTGGVLLAERRLRRLMGLSTNDGKLIRPANDPHQAEMVFAWDSALADAMQCRPELRRQRMQVHRRELELVASRNFLQPRLDSVARYRFRGLGDDLAGDIRGNNSSAGQLFDGDKQEWQLGAELTVPLGYRRAHAAVQNAELKLCRDMAVLREQERQVSHDLGNAIAEADRAYEALQACLNRLDAADKRLGSLLEAQKKSLPVDAEKLLDAYSRVTRAKSSCYLAQAEYAVAIKNVSYERGTLLTHQTISIATDSTQAPMPLEKAPESERAATPRKPAQAPVPAASQDDSPNDSVEEELPPPPRSPQFGLKSSRPDARRSSDDEDDTEYSSLNDENESELAEGDDRLMPEDADDSVPVDNSESDDEPRTGTGTRLAIGTRRDSSEDTDDVQPATVEDDNSLRSFFLGGKK